MQAAFPVAGPAALQLFRGMPGAESLVLAALQGQGRVLADHPLHPRCAVATVGDFLFCGGEPGLSARHILRQAMGAHTEWLIQAQGKWLELLKSITPVKMISRMAFVHDVQPDDAHLHDLLKAMPANAAFQPIEGDWIGRCRNEAWSRDFVSLFSQDDYEKSGLGVLLQVNGETVAGASSYVCYPGGIEIQLQTRDGFEGRGYATLAAAKLIMMAHARGLIATWDAANPASAHIAEKLGYRQAGLYQVAMIAKEQETPAGNQS